MNAARGFAAAVLLLGLGASPAQAREEVRIVNEGGIGDSWMLADGVQLAAPGYPAQFVDTGDSVCLAMGYAIKPDGTTSDFSLLRRWSSGSGEEEPADGYWDAFAHAGANALSQWKFKPRPEVDAPQTTYTVATLSFYGRDGIDANALRQHCRIDDLQALVEKNNTELQRRDRAIEQHDRDNMARRAASSQPFVDNPGITPPPQPTPQP